MLNTAPQVLNSQTSLLSHLGVNDSVRIGTTSSSPFTGSPTFDEAPFHVNVNKRPNLGTFILIQTDNAKIAHYGRIIDGQEENIRADPNLLQKNQAYQIGSRQPRPSDQDPHVTRIMMAEILGQIYLENKILVVKEPQVLPQTGMSVYEFPVDSISLLLETPKQKENGIFLGRIESGEKETEVLLPLEALARHIVILGKTGVGKSYASGVLVEEIIRHEIPVVAFDVLGDLIPATEELEGVNLKAAEDFRIPYSVIGRKEFLEFISNLTEDQEEIVGVAYETIYAQAMDSLRETGNVDIKVERLLDEIENVAEDFGQVAVGGRAKRKVQSALRRNKLITISTGEWISQLINKPIVNIYVGHLGQTARNLVVGASARVLQILRKEDKIPPFSLILDEAHFFLPGGAESTPSTHVVREMIRTARHDAIGIILITQSPSSMDKQTLLVCNTRLVFALDPDDLKVVSGTLGDLPEATLKRIPKLARGTAILSSAQDILRHPVLIKVRIRNTKPAAPTPNLKEVVKTWHQKHKN
jgi:DNA helicase HerA-like ATPase